MARRIRLDAPGAAHHVMIRGIEGKLIFRIPDDYHDFVDRMSRLLPEEDVRCFAWVLMPNHAHFVIQTEEIGLSRVMRRLNTGYAQAFNRRWSRRGYLFQNRFRSRLVTDDPDLMGLIRYVHRNPLEAGLVRSLDELARFPWSGHAALMGFRPSLPFERVDDTLSLFHRNVRRARHSLLAWMSVPGEEPEPSLVPASASGSMISASPGLRSPAVLPSDPVSSVTLEALLAAARDHYGVADEDLRSGRKKSALVRVRAVVAYWSVARLRIPTPPVAVALGVSPSTVSACVDRGRHASREDGFQPFVRSDAGTRTRGRPAGSENRRI